MIDWMLLFIYGMVFFAFIAVVALFFIMLNGMTNNRLQRRYKPENDIGRRSETDWPRKGIEGPGDQELEGGIDQREDSQDGVSRDATITDGELLPVEDGSSTRINSGESEDLIRASQEEESDDEGLGFLEDEEED